MSAADMEREVRELLVRIDERVRAVQEDIREINETRRCHTHQERMVWGCMACVTGVAARVIYDVLR